MTRYECRVDVEAVKAIDSHVHIEVDAQGNSSLPDSLMEASAALFRAEDRIPTLERIAELYREKQMAAVVFTVDARTNLGHPALDSFEIAAGAARNADVLIPYGSVDPLQGAAAVDRARSLVEDAGVMGFKFHPSVQGFDPSDDAHDPLWSALEELRVPALFHTGQNGIGAGLPGGAGIRLGFSNPMLLDVVAARHPELDVIFAHPSVPWQEEANSIAIHKTNVWIDLSGWAPKRVPESLVRLAGRRLQDRVLFGTDFPLLSTDRWLAEFADWDLDAAVRDKILRTNVARLLRLN